jgi:glycosyltransferase involved in cell wall biosynthesis
MKFVVLSHKETWAIPSAPSGFGTIGGFPFQMQALSELFAKTTLVLPLRQQPPGSVRPLTGYNVKIIHLPEPVGRDLRRKIALLTWLPKNLPKIWREIQMADAVHTPVPGDIGFIGLLISLIQRKRLFARHCGTWGEPMTRADKVLLWLLERIAGGRNVVMATGWAEQPPSKKNPNISWIFSTTLSETELANLPKAQPWQVNEPLRLVTVGRLSEGKNVQALIQALPLISDAFTEVSLDVVGDGEHRGALEALVEELNAGQQVKFHGNVTHEAVLQILSRAHLFVFPTQVKEGFPKAVLEALAVGLPVIATGVSVIPHLIKDCGLVLPDTSPEAVAQAVKRLAAQPVLMTEMATRARQRAREYTLEAWRDAIGERLQAAWGPLKASSFIPFAPAVRVP